jgi:hypothetical protein
MILLYILNNAENYGSHVTFKYLVSLELILKCCDERVHARKEAFEKDQERKPNTGKSDP